MHWHHVPAKIKATFDLDRRERWYRERVFTVRVGSRNVGSGELGFISIGPE